MGGVPCNTSPMILFFFSFPILIRQSESARRELRAVRAQRFQENGGRCSSEREREPRSSWQQQTTSSLVFNRFHLKSRSAGCCCCSWAECAGGGNEIGRNRGRLLLCRLVVVVGARYRFWKRRGREKKKNGRQEPSGSSLWGLLSPHNRMAQVVAQDVDSISFSFASHSGETAETNAGPIAGNGRIQKDLCSAPVCSLS